MATVLLLAVCLLSFCSADGQDVTHNVTGPDFLVTDETRKLTLTSEAATSPGDRYNWFTPGSENNRCETSPSGSVCTFTPRLDDDKQNVSCAIVVASGGLNIPRAFYEVNLKYPPQSNPNITIKPSQTEPLKQGDIITCTVSGGKPSVTNVTFHCQHPDLADREDDVRDDGRTVSSSITVHLSNTTEVNMTCTCSAHWEPESGLYSNQTTRSFLLESRPRIMDSSYDPSRPPILEPTGRTFFLLAYPVPDTTKSYFLGTNMTKEPVQPNTFKTQFTKNSTMTHLVNCRVTPQNVPEEKLGLYELSISNGLGDVSVRFNVTSSVIQPKKSTGTSIGKTIGIIVGVVVVGIVGLPVGIIFAILIRRKQNAGQKGNNASNNYNPNNGIAASANMTLPPTATPHDVPPDAIAPDANDKTNACPSSTLIESEPGYATPGEVGLKVCRSTDSYGGTIINSEEDDYNRLKENNAPPVDSSTYSRLDGDSRGAQPEGSADSATPNSIASRLDKPTDNIIGPKGDVYSTVAQQQKGGNQPPTDEE